MITVSGYRRNKNFPSEDKCVICLRSLDPDKLSDTIASFDASKSFFGNKLSKSQRYGSYSQTTTSADAHQLAESSRPTSKSVSWTNLYAQRIFASSSSGGIHRKVPKVVKMKNCSHSYHDECIKKWMRTNNTCPLCKTKVNTRMLLTFHPHNSPYFSIITV